MTGPKTITDRLRSGALVWLMATVSAACADEHDAAGSVLSQFPLTEEFSRQWRLPNRLNEISGLALAPDGRLFAVADERAIVYELDYDEGRIIKAFAFGEEPVRGDFEGIAILGGKTYLITSGGDIYAGGEGADGERVAFEFFRTGVGQHCEIEGLAELVGENALLFVCKRIREGSDFERLQIFSWSAETRQLLPDSLELPERDILRRLRVDRFNPSGMVADPLTGNLLIVASRQHALAEISRDGELIDARVLPLARRHRQAEGIELGGGGKLFIADEGGSHKARLAVYKRDAR